MKNCKARRQLNIYNLAIYKDFTIFLKTKINIFSNKYKNLKNKRIKTKQDYRNKFNNSKRNLGKSNRIYNLSYKAKANMLWNYNNLRNNLKNHKIIVKSKKNIYKNRNSRLIF